MSIANTLNIESYRLIDPRLSQKQSSRSFQIPTGGSQINVRKEPSNSAGNNSTITFQLTPNSPNNVIDRSMLVETNVTITFRGNPLASAVVVPGSIIPLLVPSCDAPRSLSNAVSSTNLSINGLTLTQETRLIHHVFTHFGKLEEQVKFQSISPSLMSGDYCQDYNDFNGTLLNSIGDITDSTRARFGRGSYQFEYDDTVPNRFANGEPVVIKFKLFELLTISPLVFDQGLYPGITNCTSLQLSLTLQNLSRLWSHNRIGAGTYFTSVDVAIGESYVHFSEITLPVFLSVPPSISLSYYDIQRQTTGANAGSVLAPGQTATIYSNTYQINQVPSRIIVYVKESDNSIISGTQPQYPGEIRFTPRNAFDAITSTPDSYSTIEKIDIQYNAQSSILNSASPEQLFMMSSRNGVDMSFAEWRGFATHLGATNTYDDTVITDKIPTVGSILCLDFAKDIASDPTALPGVSINANFQIGVTHKNNSNRSVQYELTVLYVYAGVIVVAPGSSFKYSSILTRDEVLNLPLLEGDCNDKLQGGDFKSVMSSMKSGLGRVGEKFKPLAKKVASKALDMGAEEFGLQDERDMFKKYTGMGMRASGMTGGSAYSHGEANAGLVGGKAKSKRSLKDSY